MCGHRKRLLDPHRELVLERLKAVPDLTLKAMVAELTERGYRVGPTMVWSLLRKAAERTAEVTWKRVGDLLNAFPPGQCVNYPRNCPSPTPSFFGVAPLPSLS